MTTNYPLTPDQLFTLLENEAVRYEVIHHAPLMTVQDSKAIRKEFESDEGQVKNLFLKNKKGRMWLLTLHESRVLDLKQAAMDLGAKRFSFCSEERLMTYLGVLPGAVTPLGLLNDRNHEVTFYIDEALVNSALIYPHPLVNTMTLCMKTQDLMALLERHGHVCNVLGGSLR